MKRKEEERQLTKAEMEIMDILWTNASDKKTVDEPAGMTTHEIISCYPEPKPAYSTIATFLKILTNKGFIQSCKQEGGGKTFVFYPLISREEYTYRVMKEVKSTFFAGSFRSMLSYFAKQEEVSDEDLAEILTLIKEK